MTKEQLARRFHLGLQYVCSRPGGFTRRGTFHEVATFIDGMAFSLWHTHRDLPDPALWSDFRWWLALRSKHSRGTPANRGWYYYVALAFSEDAAAIAAVPHLYKEYLSVRFPTEDRLNEDPNVPLFLLGWRGPSDKPIQVVRLLAEQTGCGLPRAKRAYEAAHETDLPIILSVPARRARELLDQLDELDFGACISDLQPL